MACIVGIFENGVAACVSAASNQTPSPSFPKKCRLTLPLGTHKHKHKHKHKHGYQRFVWFMHAPLPSHHAPCHSLLPDDWEHFEFLLNHAFERVPALQDAGIVSMVNGPESFTSDSRYILGESPEVPTGSHTTSKQQQQATMTMTMAMTQLFRLPTFSLWLA